MTVMLASRTPLDGALPAVRVKPAPALEPPYDDERPAEAWPICPGQLEIVRPPLASRRRPTVPALPLAHSDQAGSGAQSPTPQPSSEARIAAHRFVGACVEVLNGFRPPGHLRALCTPLAYPDTVDQLTRRAVRIRMMPQRGTAAGRPAAIVLMRRLRVCEPRAGVAEAAAVLITAETAWAMAVRLERHRGGWLCTLLQVI